MGGRQYIIQMITAIKREINSNTIIVRDFTIPHTPMEQPPRQKINKETYASNDE